MSDPLTFLWKVKASQGGRVFGCLRILLVAGPDRRRTVNLGVPERRKSSPGWMRRYWGSLKRLHRALFYQ